MPDPKKKPAADDVDVAIDEYAKALKGSIETYAELAKNAAKRVAGDDADQPDTTWADDAAAYWAQLAKDQAAWAKAVTEVFQGSSKKGTG